MVRIASAMAIVAAGDGLIGALFPRRHVQRWERGPRPYQRAMAWFRRRPGATRALAAVQLGVALAVAAHLPDED